MPRGRPKGTGSSNERQVCQTCKQNQTLANYYKSNNSMYLGKQGTFPICKDCIKDMTDDGKGGVDIKKFEDILMLMNRPLLPQVWENAVAESAKKKKKDGTYGVSPIGIYIAKVSAKSIDYVPMGFNDLMSSNSKGFDEQQKKLETEKITGVTFDDKQKEELEQIAADEKKAAGDYLLGGYKETPVTDEMRDLFGVGLSMQEYVMMDKKYRKLTESYAIKTAMHREFLVTYVKYKVKEEMAIAEGDLATADKCNAMATKAAENAKLTPKQMTAEDLQDGLSSFSEIFDAVEGAKDIIPILPRFKQQPNDMADFIIWNYVNYERELNGMPRVSYADIYKFYDERKEEYIQEHGDPFGIFSRDNTQNPEQRKAVEKFITVPKDGDDE